MGLTEMVLALDNDVIIPTKNNYQLCFHKLKRDVRGEIETELEISVDTLKIASFLMRIYLSSALCVHNRALPDSLPC